MRHRCLVMLALAVAVAIIIVVSPSTAAAHTVLVRADPASGAVLAESPGLARLWFSDEMAPSRSTARLIDQRGANVSGTRLVVGSRDPRVIAVVLPRLAPGSYGLVWEAVSAEDGHATNGTVLFAIGAASAFLQSSGGSSTELLRRWAALASLAGLVGPLAVYLLVLGRREDPASVFATARRRLLTTALAAGLMALLISIADLLVRASEFTDVLGGDWGRLWIVHTVALALLCVLVVLLGRQGRLRWQLAFAVVALLGLLMWVEALGSHAAALPSGRIAALVAGAVHAFTGLLWLGAVPALLVVLWPRGRSRSDLALLVRSCRGSFSVLAGGSVLLLLVTGLYSAGLQVATTSSLVVSSYGRLLLLKTGLLAAMGVLGLINARRLQQRPRPARTIAVETGVGLVLLVAVAALVNQPPPLGAAASVSDASPGFSSADGPADRTALTRSGSVADLVVTVSATPNQPGANWFTVIAESSRRPSPAPIDQVELLFGVAPSGRSVALERLTGTRYFATYQAEAAGALRLVAVVHRAGHEYAVPLDWQVAPVESPVTSGRPLAPYVDVAAVLLLEGALVAFTWRLLRRSGGGSG
ncbi:copper resistance protein CopC [Kribbella qitaiheensis]|uniref:copper resistance CopC/CopD family protein n=1 Tax=Kribbella qitaiheensis TaxID=1544730 RepID=UPI003615649B